MRKTLGRARTVVLAAALMGLVGCGPDILRADRARVVVDADPAEPLVLLVSTDFIMIYNPDTGRRSPAFVSTDTLSLGGDFDQTYELEDHEPHIYVRLANPSGTPEQVRLRVFLDGSLEYDASASIASPGYLQYTYSSDSAGSNG